MRKLLLFLVPLIAIAVAYSWWTGQAVSTVEKSAPAEDSSAEASSAETVSSEPATAVVDNQAEPANDESEATAESAPDESLQTGAESENTANEESPFTVVEQPADSSSTEAAVEPSSGDTQPVADVEAATEAAEPADQQQKIIVVPESYPVTDAEKYFVPKDQRSPGNLGGPPPLDFPGGPSDPNRVQPGSDIAAPAAPGQ